MFVQGAVEGCDPFPSRYLPPPPCHDTSLPQPPLPRMVRQPQLRQSHPYQQLAKDSSKFSVSLPGNALPCRGIVSVVPLVLTALLSSMVADIAKVSKVVCSWGLFGN